MELAPKRPTINDLAKIAGVSISTASKAMNGTGRVSQARRDEIKRLAKELGFRPSTLARGLQSKRSFTIGVLTNDSYGRFTLPLLTGISRALVSHEISVFLCAIEDDPQAAKAHLTALLDKQVDGIIATGRRVDRSLPIDLSNLGIPVVYAFAQGPSDAITLMSDDEQGGRLAAEHLLQLGRKRIAHVTGPESFQAARNRAAGFLAVANSLFPVLHGPWSEAHGHAAVTALWSHPNPPDGIFCGNDQIARGMIDALRERGVRVPADVAVAGFDNWEVIAEATRPPLSSIDMQLAELGCEAALIVRALVDKEPVAPGLRKLPCKLIIRHSTDATQPSNRT